MEMIEVRMRDGLKDRSINTNTVVHFIICQERISPRSVNLRILCVISSYCCRHSNQLFPTTFYKRLSSRAIAFTPCAYDSSATMQCALVLQPTTRTHPPLYHDHARDTRERVVIETLSCGCSIFNENTSNALTLVQIRL